MLNAWPLDEAYVDYVEGDEDADIINNLEEYHDAYLTAKQVRMMSFQSDMILQFAAYLDEQYPADLEVYAEAYVAHNGCSSRLLVEPKADLSLYHLSLWHLEIILPE